MPIARTLSGYIARQFLTWFGAVFGTMISIAFLLDYIELMRRSGSRDQATWGVLLEMAALKLPHTAQDVMPFAILFGTMLVFWRLTRSNELVAARAAGDLGMGVSRARRPDGAADRDGGRHAVQPDRIGDAGQLREAGEPNSAHGRRSDQPVEWRAMAAPERRRRRSGDPARRETRRARSGAARCRPVLHRCALAIHRDGSRRDRPARARILGDRARSALPPRTSRPSRSTRCGSPPV